MKRLTLMCARDKGRRRKGSSEVLMILFDGVCFKGKLKNEEVAGGDLVVSEVSVISEYKYSTLTVLREYI